MRSGLVHVLTICVLAPLLFGCGSSETEMKAHYLYEEAQKSFKQGEYLTTVTKINEALSILDKTKEKGKFGFYNGEVRFLRGQAYEALGRTREALVDYETAIEQGEKFFNDLGLTSDPAFDAVKKHRARVKAYHEHRNALMSKTGPTK